ncbi:unnamed protein product [Mesocestoides corti]|uniref:Deacetylase sirtuin-type domain-containing protein n=1 Tax=Mesocestoides corti TaxID=53468 RepID=A0A0R3URU3_MESCO|nr:unnamed protein product [Mesocestoides corti]
MSPPILPSDSASLWGILFSVLSERPHRRRLVQFATLDSVVKLLRDRSRIHVHTGAGISVSCGIPDFRSRDGVQARLARDYPDLKSPQDMFDMEFFMKGNPYPFFKFARELFPGQFKPSFEHRFIKLLERKGKLLRNYTQNIDALEQAAGITWVIQCHGSFATASCESCQYQVPGEAVREAIMSQRVPRCPRCCPDQGLSGSPVQTTPTTSPAASTSSGLMKPNIVFFGEGLPYEFHTYLEEDVHHADLILVIGSSLTVEPVSLIPRELAALTPFHE